MADVVLRSVFESRGYTRPIEDGRVTIPGVKLDIVKVVPINKAMNAVANGEYDLGEITLVDYILTRHFGRPLTALPVFVNRNFHHHRIWYHTRSGIKAPKDIEGKRVGVKSYTQTAPVWNRGVLASEYGVDIDKVTWVNIQGPHVGEFRDPPNVVPATPGKSLMELLESGEIDAADDPGRPWSDRGEPWKYDLNVIKPLVTNVQEAATEWYHRTGSYPIMHVLVVKRDAVARRPTVLRELYNAFVAARDLYMENLDPKEMQMRGRAIVGRNFLPYGVAENRPTIDMLCEFCFNQKITPKRYQVEDMFDFEFIAR
jgi:4,5-dihydroxyphthalate decarboxylase